MREYTKTDPFVRFDKYCMPVTESGCIIWLGSEAKGYGRFALAKGKTVRAHRFSYERHIGPIPDGMEPDHLCRVTLCVNPHHLEAVTRTENNKRSCSPSGLNSKKKSCKRGHLLDGENLYEWNGHRICRMCRRGHSSSSYKKHREKNIDYMKRYYKTRKAERVMP